jgi:hypothetical protein
MTWCCALGVNIESWVDEPIHVMHPSPTRGFECTSLETGEVGILLVGEPIKP